MTVIRLGSATLNRSRFALSPLAETISVLTSLQRGDSGTNRAEEFGRQRSAYQQWLAGDAVARGLLRLCSSTKYLPDLVALPPASMATRFEDELTRVAAWTDAAALATLREAQAHAWASADVSWASGKRLGARVATALEAGWTQFVEPDWERRRAVLERDVMFRAGVLAAHGWHAAIEGMTPKIHWRSDDTIEFSRQGHPDRHVGDEGLIFVPHTGLRGQWTCEEPGRFALVYPAYGTGITGAQPSDPLAALLGAARARILLELRQPACPSQLAHALDQSLGTVSGHLARLLAAGVVTKSRNKHSVYYLLTPAGQQLIATVHGAELGGPPDSN